LPEGDGFNIDVQGAAAAIDAAGGVENLMASETGSPEPQVEVPTPQGTQTTEPAATQQPRNELGQFSSPAQATTGEEQDSSFMGENFDPNSLPPELQPAYRQMQAHWTRTLQTATPYRRLAEEFQIQDPAELRQVIQFHQDLQDPSNWQTIHQELSQLLEANGMTPAQASAQATQTMGQSVQPQQADALAALTNDPELQPIASVLDDLRSQVGDLKSSLQQAQEQERQQAIQLAVQGEHQRQENIIRSSRPDWKDEDIESIYQLSVPLGGNLLDAAAQYEAMQARWAEGFISQKESPATPATAAPVNSQELIQAAMQQGTQEEAPRVPTLDEAHSALMAHLKAIGAAD